MKNYLSGGIYEITSQIMLLDLLAQLYPQRLSRLIIRHRSKIKDYYSSVAWINTLLKLGQS